jgi:hypothetical protein
MSYKDGPKCSGHKSNGDQCRALAMPNGKCYKHGGASLPPGPDNPNYLTGKYSKVRKDLSKLLKEQKWSEKYDELAQLDLDLEHEITTLRVMYHAHLEKWGEHLLTSKNLEPITNLIEAVSRVSERKAKIRAAESTNLTMEQAKDLIQQLMQVVADVYGMHGDQYGRYLDGAERVMLGSYNGGKS